MGAVAGVLFFTNFRLVFLPYSEEHYRGNHRHSNSSRKDPNLPKSPPFFFFFPFFGHFAFAIFVYWGMRENRDKIMNINILILFKKIFLLVTLFE